MEDVQKMLDKQAWSFGEAMQEQMERQAEQMDKVNHMLERALNRDPETNDVGSNIGSDRYGKGGLGKIKCSKPDKFNGNRCDFRLWLRELGSWARNAYPEARRYIEWAVNEKVVITGLATK